MAGIRDHGFPAFFATLKEENMKDRTKNEKPGTDAAARIHAVTRDLEVARDLAAARGNKAKPPVTAIQQNEANEVPGGNLNKDPKAFGALEAHLIRTAGTPKRKKHWREWFAGYMMIFPNFFGFFIFMLIPIITTIAIGCTNWDLITSPKWVGLLNYRILFRDPIFWISMQKTILFTLVNVPVQSFCALLVAILLNRKMQALNVFRTLFVTPWVCMAVAVGLAWFWMYNKELGYINHFLEFFGLQRVGWLTTQETTLWSVLVVNVWEYLGWHVILLLAALQMVPQELYEAGLVDGTNSWTRFWKITMPVISPIFFYDLVVNMITTLQIFDLPYSMTNGGPGNAARVFNLYLYQKGFQFLQMGQASAMGVIMFFLIIACTIFIFKIIGSRVNYDIS
jgi:multiple sugar transport system permease protein